MLHSKCCMIPLSKKPSLDPLYPVNYCSVSILSFLRKVIKKVVAKQLQGFLEDISALDPFCSVFCPGYGMETVLVALMDNHHRQLDGVGRALLLLLDLTGVFNTVDYYLLAHCLADVGVHGIALQCLTSYFQGRGQRVV